MTDSRENLRKVRLVFGKASPLLKAAISAAIALSTVTLITLRLTQWDTWDKAQQLHEQAAALEQENIRLQEQIDDLGTVDSIRRIAAQELGLVDPNAIIIDSE